MPVTKDRYLQMLYKKEVSRTYFHVLNFKGCFLRKRPLQQHYFPRISLFLGGGCKFYRVQERILTLVQISSRLKIIQNYVNFI